MNWVELCADGWIWRVRDIHGGEGRICCEGLGCTESGEMKRLGGTCDE